MTDGVDDRLAELVRDEGARILATLARTVGDLRLAEDAVQEATMAALRTWPVSGIPHDPRAWLAVTARHRAIDLLRREQRRAGKEQEGVALMQLSGPDGPSTQTVRDDQLRLIFTCCHPALSLPARVALALRVLCGLSVEQVAACLLTTPAATAKRLTRTRTKITAAGIPYRVPADEDLPERLLAVCAVVHALYTAGHTAAAGPALGQVEVSREAIRLARRLVELMPDEAAPAAVLASLLLTEARRATRTDPAGEVVLLADQDRSRWDRAAIAEGIELLNRSLRRTGGTADAYQLQAALAAQHALAPTYADTDWAEILRLYDLLRSVYPSAAVELNRVVAIAEVHGPAAGRDALDRVRMHDARWWAVRAELLARDGAYADAVTAAERALACEAAEPEQRHRRRRRDEWAARAQAAAIDG
ncbi:MAG: DUF6596 domain-containing protein [bacterium]